MPLMYQQNSLHMTWCLECHRHPENFVGDKDTVFQSNWSGGADRRADGVPRKRPSQGEQFVIDYHIKNAKKMSDCYTCHR